MNRIDFRTISIWSGALMILVVVGGAIALLVSNAFSERLYGTKRIIFVILLLIYAVYRVYRMRQIMRSRS